MAKQMIMGNQAIALGALKAGVNLVAGSPGTPSSDIIICDLNGYDGTDGIYTIIYKGNGFVKRLQRTSDGVKIISDNRHYDPMFESAQSDDFRVIGKVRAVMHSM